MSGVNKAILIGRLGADPELKYAGNGNAILRLRMATSETWKDKGGEKQERTEWHTVTMFGTRAEALSKHLGKGQMIYIEGRIQTRQWEDKDGGKRYSTEIVANDLQFLGGGKGGGGQQREERPDNRGRSGRGAPTGDEFPPDDGWGGDGDQIPFREVDERLA
jgi:single-strand DNA-binding protein